MRCSHYTDIYVYNINSSIEDRVVSNLKVCCASSSGSNIKWEVRNRGSNTYANQVIGEDTSSNTQGTELNRLSVGRLLSPEPSPEKGSSYYASGVYISTEVRVTFDSELEDICCRSYTCSARSINRELSATTANLENFISRCCSCDTYAIEDANVESLGKTYVTEAEPVILCGVDPTNISTLSWVGTKYNVTWVARQ